MTIQLPPLSSSSTGPPQKLVRQATRAHYPETAAYGPRKEDATKPVTSTSWSTATDRGLPPEIWFEF